MRKRIVLLLGIMIFAIGIGYYLSLPDYLVHNSISNSNSYHGTRDTELKVIVYHFWDYFDDELMELIYEEHMEINDYMDTSVGINLYYSKWHDEPYETEKFYRE